MYRNNTITVIMFVFAVITVVTGCSKNDSTVDTSGLKGKFVLDELNVSAEMKKNPVDDSMWCYIAYSFKYHFENEYGFLNRFSIMPDAEIGQVVNSDGYPYPPEKFIISSTDTLVEKENLSNRDSLNINFEMKGAFFKNVNDKYEFTDNFDEKVLKRVKIIK